MRPEGGSRLGVGDQSVAEVRPVANTIDYKGVAGRNPVFQDLLGDSCDPRLFGNGTGKLTLLVLKQGLVNAEDLPLFDKDAALHHLSHFA